MREAAFQKRVTDMASTYGWKWWHVPSPMVKRGDKWVGAKQAAGLPDLVMIHDSPPRMILAEVKGTGGKLSDEQREFLTLARDVADEAAGAFARMNRADRPLGVYVFTPDMEPAIEQLLRSRILT